MGLFPTIMLNTALVSLSEREGFNISALESCELGIPTFVRLACFDHKNLYEISKRNMPALLTHLTKPVNGFSQFTEDYSWDKLARKLDLLLTS